MKLLNLILILIIPGATLAQPATQIDVFFENTSYQRIEQPQFFMFKENWQASRDLPDQQMAQQYFGSKPGDQSQPISDFALVKITDSHYIIHLKKDKPVMIYINQHPVLVSPGDQTKVTYRVISRSDIKMTDTIYSEGTNSKNYTFSSFFTKRLIKGDNFPDLRNAKYLKDVKSLYKDLTKAYEFRASYYRSNLKSQGYDSDITTYILKMNQIEFLANAIHLETELYEKSKDQWPAFRILVHQAFADTKFPTEYTAYSARIEETIYAYFWHLTHVEYKDINSKQSFDHLFNYIVKYPDPFVKEYFLFFLIAEYNSIWKKFSPDYAKEVVKNINNITIKKELTRYSY